jgi:hypothetical protein
MEFKDEIKVKGDKLTIWKVYADGRKELAFDDSKPKGFFDWLHTKIKKKIKWDKR